uniref:Uncharacterized protein n=1 Tax=Anguilla anguilla TaxID=7936 RepID=A0A0E9WQP8_ANGAN
MTKKFHWDGSLFFHLVSDLMCLYKIFFYYRSTLVKKIEILISKLSPFATCLPCSAISKSLNECTFNLFFNGSQPLRIPLFFIKYARYS